MSHRLSVCVVGAGAAGLCAARHLGSQPSLFSFRVYEQSDGVGGTWLYTEKTGMDDDGLPVHSCMYESLRTNVMQEIMGFQDFPFPKAEKNSYPRHEVVLKYLQDYASHFDLYKHVSFRTVVKSVRPATDSSWAVTLYSHTTKHEETQVFDAVMVCNGHNSTPLVPDIPAIECFEGEVLHSRDFRRGQRFRGQRVALLGASASGRDLALELAGHAEQVLLCHHGPRLVSRLPAKVQEAAAIASATRNGFVLEDGTSVEVDTLIYCTGYMYTFPFLSPECGVFVRGKRVRPLYKQMINIEKPTLAFIGIPFLVVPFPMFHYQVAFFLKSLVDPTILPGKDEMYEEERRDFLKRLDLGYPPRYAHKLANLQFEYNDELADAVGLERLHPSFKELCAMGYYEQVNFLTEYRNKCYKDIYKEKINNYQFDVKKL